MGCGISKIDPEEAIGRLKRSHHNKRNIIDNKSTVVDGADHDFVSSDDHHNGPRKSVSCNLPVIAAINTGGGDNGVVEETDNAKRDDYNEDGHAKDSSFYHGEDIAACPASPSFRCYCTVDSDSSYGKNLVHISGKKIYLSYVTCNIIFLKINNKNLCELVQSEMKPTQTPVKIWLYGLRALVWFRLSLWLGSLFLSKKKKNSV